MMDADAALEFVDQLVYTKTGKHLNDLERKVFIGSWEGQTYREIYPFKPEHVEKNVGFKLWKKISKASHEEFGKLDIRGPLERAIKRQKQIAIIYREQSPDAQIAKILGQSVQTVGEPFLANLDTVSNVGDSWVSQLESKLTCCDYFVLVLSSQMAMSEMAIEILRRIWDHYINLYKCKPWLLVLHLRTDSPFPLNHDLRNYLAGAQQYSWEKSGDEILLVQDLLEITRTGQPPTIAFNRANSTEYVTESFCENSPLYSATSEQLGSTFAAPPPVADPELPRGQVRLISPFYVERHPQDMLCYEEILNPGALIRIKAPRQMGKTSLMARILFKAREQGYKTIPLSFQHADQDIFNDLEKLLRWLCARVARKLNLPSRLEDFWTDTYGSKDNCTAYFEDYLLPEITTPLVLGMDEVDRVFHYAKSVNGDDDDNGIASDFFGLLRAWYEEGGYGAIGSSLWEKLRLVIVHSTEVYIPLDINQSPFNVGLPIELKDFELEQVTDLACRHGLHWTTTQIEQLMTLIGGHPYLVRLAFYYIAQQQLTLDQLLETAATEAGIYGDHLRRHLWVLHCNSDLATAFNQVLASQVPVRLESTFAFKLHSLGLVKFQGNGVVPRFELYRQYFSEQLKMAD